MYKTMAFQRENIFKGYVPGCPDIQHMNPGQLAGGQLAGGQLAGGTIGR